jgi:hypothetical protein
VFEQSIPAGLMPIKMNSSIVSFDQYTPAWTLADIDEHAMEQTRRFVSRITFDSPFNYVPLVHVGITGFDVDHNDSARLNIHAESIDETGFDIVVQTWQYSRIYQVEISWLALGN